MANSRRLTWLVTLTLLFTTLSIVGHFATDAVCAVLDATDGADCTSGELGNNSTTPTANDLHSSFSLPTTIPTLPLITLTFALALIVFVSLTYSPAPSFPPPKSCTSSLPL